jgi:hypothetical protein
MATAREDSGRAPRTGSLLLSPQARAAARSAAAFVVAAAVLVYLSLLAVVAFVATLHLDRVRCSDAELGACCAAGVVPTPRR